MTEALVLKAREYLENVPESYISNDVILRWLNTTRRYVDELQIFSEDYAYDNESRVYLITYSNIMNLVLLDDDFTEINSSNYTLDAENGLVTFDDSYTVPSVVYATFTYHDLFNAVAECWKYMASKAKISGKVKLADEDLPEDYSSREYCIRKYWDHKPSMNITMER